MNTAMTIETALGQVFTDCYSAEEEEALRNQELKIVQGLARRVLAEDVPQDPTVIPVLHSLIDSLPEVFLSHAGLARAMFGHVDLSDLDGDQLLAPYFWNLETKKFVTEQEKKDTQAYKDVVWRAACRAVCYINGFDHAYLGIKSN